ncbi:Efflux transporter, RND family, MFP subunit [Candidatus Terasakiella magnetica]|uniref:Efflux transporter, RND family, MFP subunit n=1 Tax=Candidatus Terasakiella magnetica TaxID=1867952 RepID=A0A1C3RK55_9PROT|nr:efflux RND transporter periplasmic adaptor subunit [Candidatus Terasakiella magnetica]SCA57680.1 Efflux transporter, RND family, MFP subunit [Candidatus Terasakiella magnetica]
MKKLYQLGALTLCSLIALHSVSHAEEKKGPPPATAVGVDSVEKRTINQTIPVSGRLIAKQAGEIAARINAPVDKVLVDVGDKVFAGQALVHLVSDRLKHQKELALAEQERAQAALQTAKAQYNIVSQELKRLQRLRKSAAFNQARYDDKRLEQIKAKSAVSEAEAAVRKAKADMSLRELDLTYSKIVAPYPGTITLRQVDQGDYVSVGQSVLQIINARDLEIEADVATNRLSGLKAGTIVSATLSNQTSVQTKVRAVVPEENPLTRTRAVRFTPSFDPTKFKLAGNQTLTLDIPLGEVRKVLSVSKDAILNKKGGQIVFAIKGGKATITPVKLGDAMGSYFEVISGLSEGDVVVVRGNERLRPNQRVKAMGQAK